ncbi:MAG: hypothetical protein OXU19_17825 [bacterium]|nr:hypothetical protein [bacterium]MDE0415866.1 hypothetical protein [bacterium]
MEFGVGLADGVGGEDPDLDIGVIANPAYLTVDMQPRAGSRPFLVQHDRSLMAPVGIQSARRATREPTVRRRSLAAKALQRSSRRQTGCVPYARTQEFV